MAQLKRSSTRVSIERIEKAVEHPAGSVECVVGKLAAPPLFEFADGSAGRIEHTAAQASTSPTVLI